jgi:hypothetical protein
LEKKCDFGLLMGRRFSFATNKWAKFNVEGFDDDTLQGQLEVMHFLRMESFVWKFNS